MYLILATSKKAVRSFLLKPQPPADSNLILWAQLLHGPTMLPKVFVAIHVSEQARHLEDIYVSYTSGPEGIRAERVGGCGERLNSQLKGCTLYRMRKATHSVLWAGGWLADREGV